MRTQLGPMPRMPKPSGVAVASAILAHAAALLAWGASGLSAGGAVAGRNALMTVRLIEPVLVEQAAPTRLAERPDLVGIDSRHATAPAPVSSRVDQHPSTAAVAAVQTPIAPDADRAGEPRAKPDHIVVRVAPSDIDHGPSHAVLSVSLSDSGQVIDAQSVDAPLPPAFEEALRTVLAETHFRFADAGDRPTPSRIRVQASFEASELAQ